MRAVQTRRVLFAAAKTLKRSAEIILSIVLRRRVRLQLVIAIPEPTSADNAPVSAHSKDLISNLLGPSERPLKRIITLIRVDRLAVIRRCGGGETRQQHFQVGDRGSYFVQVM